MLQRGLLVSELANLRRPPGVAPVSASILTDCSLAGAASFWAGLQVGGDTYSFPGGRFTNFEPKAAPSPDAPSSLWKAFSLY